MKLQIKTTFDFGKLAGSVKKLVDEFKEQTILAESKEMTNRLKAGKTIGQSFTNDKSLAQDFATDWGYNDSGIVLVIDSPKASDFIINFIWSVLLGQGHGEVETFGVKNMPFKAIGTTYHKFFKLK